MGKRVGYSNTGNGRVQGFIDANPYMAGTYSAGKTFRGTDGVPTAFAGHSHAAFKNLWNIGAGSKIIVTDGNGNAYTYKVSEVFVANDNGVMANGKDRLSEILGTGSFKRGGEYIILQTCKTSTENYFVKAWKQ